MDFIELLGLIVAVLTFPVSIIALIVDWIFHIGFWTAWWIVLIVSLLSGGGRISE
jgi:hypothetical protein